MLRYQNKKIIDPVWGSENMKRVNIGIDILQAVDCINPGQIMAADEIWCGVTW